ncbi:MAG: ABC transporter ATP-binding protein [Alcanivoracaceae bacterium]|nr:ABC transporter ATP-binding protein [Alcanivoracaceae bacterium]
MKLSINNLCKTYANGVVALDDLSLDIGLGLFGLLGPNGAGKSSLMRTIAALQTADSGTVSFDEIDVLKQKAQIRKVLGYLPQEFGVFPKTSAYKLLDYYALLKGIGHKKQRKETVEGLLNLVNLYQDKNKNVYEFSGGMKQRFGIAQALIGNPKLIIVDEPTAGLDPGERVRFNNLLSQTGEDRIVLLSTHIVDDVSDLCSDMAIINKGKVIMKGAPVDLIDALADRVWEKQISKKDYDKYCQKYEVIHSRLHAGNPLIHIMNEDNPENGFVKITPKLDDVYFTAINTQNNNVSK